MIHSNEWFSLNYISIIQCSKILESQLINIINQKIRTTAYLAPPIVQSALMFTISTEYYDNVQTEP